MELAPLSRLSQKGSASAATIIMSLRRGLVGVLGSHTTKRTALKELYLTYHFVRCLCGVICQPTGLIWQLVGRAKQLPGVFGACGSVFPE
ncbi:uncharacterized protein YALI1_E36409g [Yarrowia lipolytica]|uniref:Uncharacterized protein n=1 Tax=Yarrowia lipolytica TaxID=4952 RepID=A0A1D8NKR1_YARLL|nr:hypothetical protein YALI1_E36409g [Yarrowia lipolytica]